MSEYFGYQSPYFLVKDLIKANDDKNKQRVEQTIDSINKLKDSIIKKEIPENENPGEINNIAEKILKFNKQQRGTGLKILTPKQMLQKFPIAPGQIQAGNNSESLLNEVRQIVYILYQLKKITKKIYSNTIKLVKV